jgi:Flp pilus assembly protein TadG
MRIRQPRGQALVELALLSSLLLALLFGAMQFGYSFYTYNNLQKAVRDGARYAASRELPSSTFSPADSGYAAAVKNVVVCGNPGGCSGVNPLVHNLTSSNVVVTMTAAGGTPSVVTVKINGYTIPGPLSSVTLTNKPACSFRFIGRYSPG